MGNPKKKRVNKSPQRTYFSEVVFSLGIVGKMYLMIKNNQKVGIAIQ
jgi:hypothetical protein